MKKRSQLWSPPAEPLLTGGSPTATILPPSPCAGETLIPLLVESSRAVVPSSTTAIRPAAFPEASTPLATPESSLAVDYPHAPSAAGEQGWTVDFINKLMARFAFKESDLPAVQLTYFLALDYLTLLDRTAGTSGLS